MCLGVSIFIINEFLLLIKKKSFWPNSSSVDEEFVAEAAVEF